MKEKTTTGLETITPDGRGSPDDSSIIDVASNGEATIRDDHDMNSAQPQRPTESASAGEDPYYGSPDDRERIDAEQKGLGLTRRGPDGSVIEERDETSDLNEEMDAKFKRAEDDPIPSDMPLRGSPD